MDLIVNGEAKRAKAQSVRQLLAELAYEGSFFAVAINQTVVPRRDWDQSVLKDGDKIEIVSPRQGG
ncbi:MAG TPA: sulfur carrier protein ThiS [Xanthobacteraceae bacterium]|jgi:sulfur carrier protein|nr:sulfur carrier protein ThiS [Xanthobacteraceae bacterium]